jgi:outer membrane protein assembly factor BamB
MNQRTKNSIVLLIIGIALIIFLVSYWNMNSYTPKIVQPCYKFRCDFTSDGNTKLIGPTSNVSIKWSNNDKGTTKSYNINSPVTDTGGNIYIGNPNGNFYSYSSNGKINWRFNQTTGAINTTACLGQYIYFGCDDGYLYALNFDGRLQWKYFIGGNQLLSSPTYDKTNGNVYIGSQYGVISVNSKGKQLWNFNTTQAIVSSPAISEDYTTLYVTCLDKNVYALNISDGTILWSYQASDAIQSSPAVGKDGTIYFGCNDGYLYAVNQQNNSSSGILVWKFNNGIIASQITSSPAIDKDGNIYYTVTEGSGLFSQGKLYSVNPNGTEKNNTSLDTPTKSSPLIDTNGNIFVGAGVFIYGISKDISIIWKLQLGDVVNSSPVLDSKSNLVVGCNDGNLYSIVGN